MELKHYCVFRADTEEVAGMENSYRNCECGRRSLRGRVYWVTYDEMLEIQRGMIVEALNIFSLNLMEEYRRLGFHAQDAYDDDNNYQDQAGIMSMVASAAQSTIEAMGQEN